MKGIELVVFDMAGTTVKDDGQVPEAFTAALSDLGIIVGQDIIRSIRGSSKREAIRRLLPPGKSGDDLAERAYTSFLSHLAHRYVETAVEVAGAADSFICLRNRGIRVALNTGFDRETAQILLSVLGWVDGTVDAIVCGNDVPNGRPAPDMIFRCMELTGVANVKRVANVGDTTLDLQAGHNAGVQYNIGVLSGAHSRDMLISEPHSHIITSVAEIPSLLTNGK
ncbi:MAG: phosphonatase-like hydrolase [Gemmataceae bacterium]|nr:phosphonatase-like hydrolase [Gemmataceae bacterium]